MSSNKRKPSRLAAAGSALSRRELLFLGAAGLATLACAGGESCARLTPRSTPGGAAGSRGSDQTATSPPGEPWRLTARPGAAGKAASPPGKPPRVKHGTQDLGLGGERDGFLHVPSGYRPDRPAPLLVMLHGATQDSGLIRRTPMPSLADELGFVLLAPDSRGPTWDMLFERRFGPDVAFLDRALARTFGRLAVDPRRIALAGFSDGATYALSLGLANGDLFTHAIAFSPGYASPPAEKGRPRIYVSHGTQDQILPIDSCSRRIVPSLKARGYEVLYHEFDGPHGITPEIAREAVGWFVGAA